MNFIEAIEGAESHYERGEFMEAIALSLVGFGIAIKESADEGVTLDFKVRSEPAGQVSPDFGHHSCCLDKDHDPFKTWCVLEDA